MAVTHEALVRNASADKILELIDADALAGYLIFRDAATVVATLGLSYPAGVVTNERLDFSAISSDLSAIAGIIDNYVITDNSGDEILYGSVTITGGGGDITLTGVTINNDDTVSMTALTYDAAL